MKHIVKHRRYLIYVCIVYQAEVITRNFEIDNRNAVSVTYTIDCWNLKHSIIVLQNIPLFKGFFKLGFGCNSYSCPPVGECDKLPHGVDADMYD